MQNESSYISLDLFERCIPPFQEGLKAKEALEGDDGSMPREERVRLRRMVHAGEDAWTEVARSIGWVIDNAVRTEINKPRTFYYTPDPDELYQAGLEGAYKMMKNADLSKMKSAVNYLMQWVNTYVIRAAYKDESQFGLSASKLQIYRKISAIRAKLADQLGRDPSDEEVYEFVNSGQAHVKTFMGKSGKGSNIKASRKADKIPLKTIQEQGEFQADGSMRYAITDDLKIDSMVHVSSTEDQALEPPTQRFWEAWFEHIGINPSQWNAIAYALSLYDVNEDLSKTRSLKRITEEIQMIIGSKTGDLSGFSTRWSAEHGPGPWDVFQSMEALPSIDVNSVDEDGKKLFRALKFVKNPGSTDTDGDDPASEANSKSRRRRSRSTRMKDISVNAGRSLSGPVEAGNKTGSIQADTTKDTETAIGNESSSNGNEGE